MGRQTIPKQAGQLYGSDRSLKDECDMQTCFTMTLCETFQKSPFLTVNKMSNSMYLDHMCFVVIPCDHNRSVMFILDPCHRTKRNFNWRVLAWTELCSSHLTCLSSVFPRNLIQVYYKVEHHQQMNVDISEHHASINVLVRNVSF